MKHLLCCCIALLLCMPFFSSVTGEETQEAAVFVLERVVGPNGSYVEYPRFLSENEAAEKIGKSITETAKIEQYLMLLGNLSENGTGLKMDCSVRAGKRYVSILLTVDGKMLSGPPGKVYYPFVFDLETGEGVPFDALFTDAILAQERISALIEAEIEPQLSTYLENSDLVPIPFERFCVQDGLLTLYYEKQQLSFLSGDPGAIAFRFSELGDVLNWGESSPIRDLTPTNAYEETWDEKADRREWQREWSEKGMLCGLTAVAIGNDLATVLVDYRCTTDEGFYPGGACYEVEAAGLRGTLLLSDEDGRMIRGILSSRLDSMGIETGKTTLEHAVSLLGEPSSQLTLDEETAERYLVCPGVAARYTQSVQIGDEMIPSSYILYADQEGIVRYILLSIL